MPQELRNKIYGVLIALGLVLTALGIYTQATVDEYMSVADRILDLLDAVLLLGTASVAWAKSRPSKVTVLDLPTEAVSEIITPQNSIIAGPASPQATGTFIHVDSEDDLA